MSEKAPTAVREFQPTKNTRFKAVVFDCDGVLFDSKAANVRFYNQILAHLGHPPVHPEQQEYVHMHPARESLQYLLGNGRTFEAAWRFCQQIDFRQFNAYLRMEPGLVPFLQALKPHYHIALATNRTVSTQEVLTHFSLAEYFDVVVTAADVPFPKPHPETMERILLAFAAAPREILFIGDSPVDETLALATDVFFAAYKNPRLKAHFHVDHFDQLHPVLFPQ